MHKSLKSQYLIIFRRNKIHIKVVNPSRNVDAVFINFALTLHIRMAPQIENGVFRTQVDLLDTEIQMEEGAFPYGWNAFVQDLVKGISNTILKT